MLGISTLTPTKHDFDYKISYDWDNNKLSFDVTHNKEFLKWSGFVSRNLTESTSNGIKITLSPKSIFNIFTAYFTGDLADRYKIVLPKTYNYKIDNELVPIRIEIHSTMEYQEEWDIKIIELYPEYVPVEQRLESKMKLIEKRFETKLDQRDKLIESLIARIEKLEDKHTIKLDPTTYIGRPVTTYSCENVYW